MELNEKDIQKINTIARVLGNALSDIRELAAKIDAGGQTQAPKRRDLKTARVERCREQLEMKLRRKTKKR